MDGSLINHEDGFVWWKNPGECCVFGNSWNLYFSLDFFFGRVAPFSAFVISWKHDLQWSSFLSAFWVSTTPRTWSLASVCSWKGLMDSEQELWLKPVNVLECSFTFLCQYPGRPFLCENCRSFRTPWTSAHPGWTGVQGSSAQLLLCLDIFVCHLWKPCGSMYFCVHSLFYFKWSWN